MLAVKNLPAFSLVAEVISGHSRVQKNGSAATKERGGVFSSRHRRSAGWASPTAAAVGAIQHVPMLRL